MSGIKETRINISQSEHQNLINRARNAECSQVQQQERARRAEAARQEALNRSHLLENMLNMEIPGLHEEIRNMAIEQNRRLQNEVNRFDQKLNDAHRRQTERLNDLSQRMEDQKRELNQRIDKNHYEVTSQLNNLDGRVKVIEEISTKQELLAKYWIDQANAFIEDLKNYRHELLCPGKMEDIRKKIDDAVADYKVPAYQIAINNGRDAFNLALNLKEEVVLAEDKWNELYGIWRHSLADTQSKLDEHDKLVFTFETTEGKETVNADLDDWTNGELSIVRGEFELLRKGMEDIDKKTIEDITEEIGKLENLQHQIDFVAYTGKENLLLSQYRWQIADEVADIVGESFLMTDCQGEYLEDDKRQAYVAKFKNPDNDEVVLVIAPQMDEHGVDYNSVEFHFNNSDNSEEMRDKWTKHIKNSLEERNIPIGNLVCREGYERRNSDQEQLGDMDRIRQRGARTMLPQHGDRETQVHRKVERQKQVLVNRA